MAYLSESDLARRAAAHPYVRNIATSRAQSKISVFLSHSHADRALVEHFLRELDNAGISIYVDWNDSTMPRVTSRTTAEAIKAAIKANRLFMVLATTRALSSRWASWEIGVADQIHPSDDILVIPVADPAGCFEGNEYLQRTTALRSSTECCV